MEFDWNNPPFEMDGSLTQREIEESFEDPFAIRLLPDSPRFGVQARFFNLGLSAAAREFSAPIGQMAGSCACCWRARSNRRNGFFISERWTRL